MKAHQRIIREQKSNDRFGLFGPPNCDIKKAELKEISREQASAVILDYEWLGTMGTTRYHYGIFYEGVLAGAVCFGYFQALEGYSSYVGDKHGDNGIQLSRGACVWWAHEHSGSKLIAHGLSKMKEIGYKYVIAFSDPNAGEVGILYQATNWYYLGFTKDVHYDIYNKDGRVYLNDRDAARKLGFRGRAKLTEYISDKPWLEVRERRSKGRYIKLIGSKHENKEMMVVLKDKIKPYPKRDGTGAANE